MGSVSMIQSISLLNFQSHESSLLEFDPGVNVIIGDSDSGKTSILRALTWVLTNRPTGEAFRRNGSGSTSVTVDTSDGAITRVRSDRENLYYGVNAEKLAAIGTSVPEPVSKVLNMDADLNLQRQLDAPFLLSCSAGEVAQRLNSVVGLDDIDIGLASAQRRVRQHQAGFEQAEKQCGVLTEQVDSFTYLVEMEQEVSQLEQQFKVLQTIQSQVGSLEGILLSAQDAITALNALPDVAVLLLQVRDVDQQLENYNRVYGQARGLSDAVEDVLMITDALGKIADISELLGAVWAGEEILRQLREYVELVQLGEDLMHSQIAMYREIGVAEDQIVRGEERLRKEFPTVCPLCGRKGKK